MNRNVAVACLLLVLFASSVATADSLWSRQRPTSLFADHRAFTIGDVLTVVVEEESSVSNSAGMSTEKKTTTDGKLDTLITGNPKQNIFPGGNPAFASSSDNKFDGTGQYQATGTMKTRLTVVVTEVLPNGNLVVEGNRNQEQGGEKTKITISGIVRPEDVASDNTVSSTALAQGAIIYTSSGPITDANKKGWLARIIDFVWPF